VPAITTSSCSTRAPERRRTPRAQRQSATEAFSVDGTLIFALDYRAITTSADHRVASGERYDTNDRDKVSARRHARLVGPRVMSADRTLLATLYRNPGDTEEPAFVHVLDLEHGWSYCADLPRPFGTGPAGSDEIELTPSHTVVVATTRSSQIAEIAIEQVHTPGDKPVTVEFRRAAIALDRAPFRSITGFGHVIAALPVL